MSDPTPASAPVMAPPCDSRAAADVLTAEQKQEHLAGPCLRFDIPREIESLRSDIGWQRDGHSWASARPPARGRVRASGASPRTT